MFQPQGEQTLVTVILGHAMTPVSAGVADSHAQAAGEEAHVHEGDDAAHDDEHAEKGDDDAMASPSA
jgi:hypothetical protein